MTSKLSKGILNNGLLAGILVGAILGSVGIAGATSSANTTIFYACLNVKAGTLNSVNTTGPAKCAKGNVATNWNSSGQPGAAGPQGPQGPQGTLPPDLIVQAAVVPTSVSACIPFAQAIATENNLRSIPSINCSNIVTVSSGHMPAGIDHYYGEGNFSAGSCAGNDWFLSAQYLLRDGQYIPRVGEPTTRIYYGNLVDSFDPYRPGDQFVTLLTCSHTVNSTYGSYPTFSSFSTPLVTQPIAPILLKFQADPVTIEAP